MRILVISNLYPPVVRGGYEARCAHTTQWLARRHEVLVLTSRDGRRGAPREEQVLRKLPFLPDDARGALRAPFASLRAARIMRSLLRSYRPDLVFVWNASQIPRVVVRIAQSQGMPVALSVADPWPERFVEGDQFLRHLAPGDRGLRRAWATLLRVLNRLPSLRVDIATPYAAAIVWNSGALQQMTVLPPLLQPVLQRTIHPASRNEELFANLPREPTPTPTIAFVGRLEWEKAPDVAVRAMALLRDRHGIDARLDLAGDGSAAQRRALTALARELGLSERVRLLGALPAGGIAELLAGAHALVVPSRWQEPFGLVCLEGALARVPIVASLSGGMPEMLTPERDALFFTIDDIEACAEALARTLLHPQAAAERVDRAFAHAGDYSLERYRADYDAFVEDAADAFRMGSTLAGSPPM
jgi:glycosyltransferase involved in cell wall biosynthesis